MISHKCKQAHNTHVQAQTPTNRTIYQTGVGGDQRNVAHRDCHINTTEDVGAVNCDFVSCAFPNSTLTSFSLREKSPVWQERTGTRPSAKMMHDGVLVYQSVSNVTKGTNVLTCTELFGLSHMHSLQKVLYLRTLGAYAVLLN